MNKLNSSFGYTKVKPKEKISFFPYLRTIVGGSTGGAIATAIYMAFYIISKYVNNEKINVNNLNDTFFDYLFLNDGNIVKVSESTKISKEILTQIKNDFNYQSNAE